MTLSLDSPRFSVRDADFDELDATLEKVGHVVIDDLWNTGFLTWLFQGAQNLFAQYDKRYGQHLEELPASTVNHYKGNSVNLGSLFEFDPQWREESADADRRFFGEIERTGITALLRHLLAGDHVVGRSERVIRRSVPTVPTGYVGLHADGQLKVCSSRGFRSKRELTLWTPLQDCSGDDTPRLLLFKRGEPMLRGMDSIKLGSFQHAENEKLTGSQLDAQFDQVYAQRTCYAPHVRMGGAILFMSDVVHGSYRRSTMTVPRYSLDCRAVAAYRVTSANRNYQGVRFGIADVPGVRWSLHPRHAVTFGRQVASKLKRMAASLA